MTTSSASPALPPRPRPAAQAAPATRMGDPPMPDSISITRPTTGTCTFATAPPSRRCCRTTPPVRAGDRHAEPAAADRPGRAGACLPAADPRGLARGGVVPADDDALPDRQHAAGGDASGARGRHPGDQALSGRRHHQQRCRRHRSGQGRRGARGCRARGRDPAWCTAR